MMMSLWGSICKIISYLNQIWTEIDILELETLLLAR